MNDDERDFTSLYSWIQLAEEYASTDTRNRAWYVLRSIETRNLVLISEARLDKYPLYERIYNTRDKVLPRGV